MVLEIGINLFWLLFALSLVLAITYIVKCYSPKYIARKKLHLEDKLKDNELTRRKDWEEFKLKLNTSKTDPSIIENLKKENASLKAKSEEVEEKKKQLAKEEEIMKMVMCLYNFSQEKDKIIASIKEANSSYEWIKNNIKK